MAGRVERRLLSLLAPATFFEGYDTLLLGLALPLIRAEFGLGLVEAGVVGSAVFAGSFGSLVLVALADRYGRRRLLGITIVGYTVATALTALSVGVADFVAYQVVARAFLGAEKPLASIMVVEAVDEDRRGRSLGVLSSMVAFGQAAAGLGFLLVVATGASWRLLYAFGVLPLLFVAAARRHLPETSGWRRTSRSGWLRGGGLRPVAGASLLVFLLAMYPSALTLFASTLVLEEWRWTLTEIPPIFFAVWAAGLSGFFAAGRLMDGRGRRPTAFVFLTGATVAGFVAFTAETDVVRAFGLGAVIFFLTGSAPVVSAFTTEPFPGYLRGRIGAVARTFEIGGGAAAPALVGVAAGAWGGLGVALAAVGVSYTLAAVTIAVTLPETRTPG